MQHQARLLRREHFPLGETASRLTSCGLEGLFEDVESALGGLAGDGQGGEEHEDVFFGGDEQAVFAAGVADLGGVVFVFRLRCRWRSLCRGWWLCL